MPPGFPYGPRPPCCYPPTRKRCPCRCPAAVSPCHFWIALLVRRPGTPTVEVIDEREDFVRRRHDRCRTLDAKRVGLGRGEGQKSSDRNDHDDGDYSKHAPPMGDLKSTPRQSNMATHCATMTIHPTPNRSATMPKHGEKNVLVSGCCTWPPSESAAKSRSASASLAASRDSEKPWK